MSIKPSKDSYSSLESIQIQWSFAPARFWNSHGMLTSSNVLTDLSKHPVVM